MTADTRGPDTERRTANAVNLGSQILQQPSHDLYIADAWNVRQDALVLGQQAGREQRERRILVSLHGHASPQPVSAFNQEC